VKYNTDGIMNTTFDKKDDAALQQTYTAGTDVEIVEEANAATDKDHNMTLAEGLKVIH